MKTCCWHTCEDLSIRIFSQFILSTQWWQNCFRQSAQTATQNLLICNSVPTGRFKRLTLPLYFEKRRFCVNIF